MVDISSLLTPVDPSEVPARQGGQRARTSGPILDAFIASGEVVSRINASALDAEPKEKDDGSMETVAEAQARRLNSLNSSLSLYALNNKYPVSVFNRGGVVHLRRLDLDDNGNERDWTPRVPKPRKPAAEANGEVEAEVEAEASADEYE